MGRKQDCLICYSPVVSKNPVMTKQMFLGSSGELAQQIVVIFTLRNMLNIPKSVCEKILQERGHPSTWGISYCAKCSNIIEDAQFVAERLKDLHDKLNTLSTQMQSILLSNFKKSAKLYVKSSKTWDAVDEIRSQFAMCKEASLGQIGVADTEVYEDNNKEKLDFCGSLKIEGTFSIPAMQTGKCIEMTEYEENDDCVQGFADFADSEKDKEYIDDDQLSEQLNYDSPQLSPEYQNSASECEVSDPEYTVPSSRPRRKNNSSRRRKRRGTDHNEISADYTVKTEVPDTTNVADDFVEKRVYTILEENSKIRLGADDEATTIHRCGRCNFKFKSELTRNAHERRVHDGIKSAFQCELCGNAYHRLCVLLEHLKDHLKSSVFLCPKCPWKFSTAIHRNAHLQRVHYGEKKPYACMKCNMKFQRPILLEEHLKENHKIVLSQPISHLKRIENNRKRVEGGVRISKPVVSRELKKFKCTQADCNFRFGCSITRDAHVKRFHFGDKTPYKCQLCPRQFHRNCLLLEHIKEHEEDERNGPTTVAEKPTSFPCLQCDKVFNRSGLLNKHVEMRHTDVPKPFMCELCSKTFRMKDYLKNHQILEHHKELNLTPFECKECGKILGTERTLEHHTNMVHKKEFVFQCPHCPVGFRYQSNREKHMLLHSGERPFKCDQCPKDFSTRTALNNHIRVHTGEKPYRCLTCDKTFSDKPTFNRHNEKHKGISFQCNMCTRTYPTRHALRVHIRNHENNGANRFQMQTRRRKVIPPVDPLQQDSELGERPGALFLEGQCENQNNLNPNDLSTECHEHNVDIIERSNICSSNEYLDMPILVPSVVDEN